MVSVAVLLTQITLETTFPEMSYYINEEGLFWTSNGSRKHVCHHYNEAAAAARAATI